MLFRYRARNYPETLSPSDKKRWEAYRTKRLKEEGASYFEKIETLRKEGANPDILDELEAWGKTIITA